MTLNNNEVIKIASMFSFISLFSRLEIVEVKRIIGTSGALRTLTHI